jgi:tetratricopeptide (TPR) repeat protein
VTGSTLADDAPLGADAGVCSRAIGRNIRQRRLRGIVLGVRLTGADRSPPPSIPLAPTGAPHWLGRAWRALACYDYHQAAYAAAMARRYGETAQIALVLALADAGLERFEDAIVEAQRAVRLAPQEPEHHLTLAGIFEDLGNWSAALRCYQAAERLDPDSDAPRIGRALVLMQSGDNRGAQRILEAVYARDADNQTAGDCLSLALIEAAEQVPVLRDGETYFITSRQEIEAMRARLTRAAEVTRDPKLLDCVAEIRGYVETCARREWLIRRMFRRNDGWLLLILLALLGSGFAALLLLDVPVALLLVAAVSPVGPIAYRLLLNSWVPRWRINRWNQERERPQPGEPATGSRAV